MKYACSVTVLGLFVLIGWMLQQPLLTSISQSWVSMKPITAILFMLCGVLGVSLHQFRTWTHPLCAVTMCLILFTFGSQLGKSSINPFSVDPELLSVGAGIPSVMTLGAFAFFVIDCWLSVETSKLRGVLQLPKFLICTGLLCMAGYLLGFSLLYFYVPGWSTAMAIHTGLGMCFLGFSCDPCK